jgi:hypothetical protein
MAAKKNSLVGNINKRKKAGTSRSKSRSTVSGEAYEEMQEGWPKQRAAKSRAKKKSGAKKAPTAKKKSGAKKKAGARKTGAKKAGAKRGGAKK